METPVIRAGVFAALMRGRLEEAVTPRTLYLSRKVLNADQIARWAANQGLKNVKPGKFHVTIAYSKTPVNWMKLGSYGGNAMHAMPATIHPDASVGGPVKWPNGSLLIEGGPRLVERFDGGAVVLCFSCPDLEWRNQRVSDIGGSWDHPTYTPHITITYDEEEEIDIEAIKPYQGEIILGPEIFDTVNENWKAENYGDDAVKKNGDELFDDHKLLIFKDTARLLVYAPEVAAEKADPALAVSTIERETQDVIKQVQRWAASHGFKYRRYLHSAEANYEFTGGDLPNFTMTGWHNTGRWVNGSFMLHGVYGAYPEKFEFVDLSGDDIIYIGRLAYFGSSSVKQKYLDALDKLRQAIRKDDLQSLFKGSAKRSGVGRALKGKSKGEKAGEEVFAPPTDAIGKARFDLEHDENKTCPHVALIGDAEGLIISKYEHDGVERYDVEFLSDNWSGMYRGIPAGRLVLGSEERVAENASLVRGVMAALKRLEATSAPVQVSTVKEGVKTALRRVGVTRALAKVTHPFELASRRGDKVYVLRVNDYDEALLSILEYLKKCGSDGHSVSFKIDDETFGFDGDGADKIYEIEVKETNDKEEAKGWSKAVTERSPGTYPPPGTFTKSAEEIYDIMKRKSVSPNGLGSAIQMCQFFINRAGKRIKPETKSNIEGAIKLLRADLDKQKEK